MIDADKLINILFISFFVCIFIGIILGSIQ